MPMEASDSPPLHRPGDVTARPKGILKNPSFSDASGQPSPGNELAGFSPSTPLESKESKEVTLQNTLQNAGHRRSSSAAGRRSSASHRQSTSGVGLDHNDDDPDKMRLKWDEANLYLAEQESGGRMKITEPKTPYQYGGPMDQDDDEDVAIDPRYVNVDEMDLGKNKSQRKQRDSEIPGLDIGEPEDETAGLGIENERIRRESNSLTREHSKDKHVSVSGASGEGMADVVAATQEEQRKHDEFEARRKKHYEMRSVKGLLGHPEDIDRMDEDDDEDMQSPKSTALPNRGINGVLRPDQ